MSISATVVADSISDRGIRITTMHLVYQRYLLPEINTHRAFSRNTRSSRAVPTAVLLKEIRENPAMPVHWGKNQPGMQAFEELLPADKADAIDQWRYAARMAARNAEALAGVGAHKQVVNRLIEPFTWAHTLVTATDWANFYALRRHADAQPEIRVLADAMWEAQQASMPRLLRPGQWHTPYVEQDEIGRIFASKLCNYDNFDEQDGYRAFILPLSVARCARISYKPFDGAADIESELARADRLIGSQPMHASPAEHQATPDVDLHGGAGTRPRWGCRYLQGNFTGWLQFRKTLPGERVPG
ncbi:FAD-dependent thymidylate synthase (plasmid) [Azospirillum sp. HJ39]|uniref:FAD-dependent thymidylate synthase n=1 Tax=Azospirillum sp. HJ39 TaxID=3159496 RepID=UPI0035567F99